jgi:alkylated DNA repair dioxygenase AlkB
MINAQFFNFEKDCYALLIPNFINDSYDLYNSCIATEFEEKTIAQYEKTITLPRLVSSYSHPMPDYFAPIIEKINIVSKQLPFIDNSQLATPNHCFLNYYRNGEDYNGWHTNENNPTYILSLGESRTFEIKKISNSTITSIQLDAGSLVIIYGEMFNTKFMQRIPKLSNSNKSCIHMIFSYQN